MTPHPEEGEMARFAIQRVRATPEALELIERLRDKHGPIAFFQPGGFGEGTPPRCLTRVELPPSDDDIKLGEVGGAPFFIEVGQYERSGRPTFLIDVEPGGAGSFSIEGLEDVHFVTRTPTRTPVGA
jgi:uncharacterized protein (DUF779 family)